MTKTTQKPKSAPVKSAKRGDTRRLKCALALNLFTIIAAVVSVIITIASDQPSPDGFDAGGLKAFRFFTIDSNLLAALSCACLLLYIWKILRGSATAIPRPVFLLKFVGTVSVTITLVTVFVFLGPTIGYAPLLADESLFLHLLCPLACLASLFCCDPLPEGRKEDKTSHLTKAEALLGFIPVGIYGVIYCLMVIVFYAWPDFYGFNVGGCWPLSAVLMALGSLAICFILRAVVNRRQN